MNCLKTSIQTGIVAGLVIATAATVQAQVFYGNPGTYQGNIVQGTVVPGTQGGFIQGAVVQQEELLAEPTEEELKQQRIGVSLSDAGASPSIRSVFTNSPAQKAGLQSGDLITKINGEATTSVADFKSKLAGLSAGASFTLTHSRDGEEKDVTVSVTTLGDIVKASIVPEAGIYDSSISQAEARIATTKQRIKNSEQDLEDMKKGLMEQEKELTELKSKAEAADKAAAEKKAKEAAMKKEAGAGMKEAGSAMKKAGSAMKKAGSAMKEAASGTK